MSEFVNTLATINAVLRFLLEIVALVVLGYWGYQQGGTSVWKYGLGIGIPLTVAILWGLVGSPNAPYPLGDSLKLLLEILIFGAATLALFDVEQLYSALIFGLIAVINTFLLYIWGGGALE